MALEVVCDVAMEGDPWDPAEGDFVQLAKVRSVTTNRGRQRQLGRMEPGKATTELFDPERALDPHRLAGYYAGKLDEQRPIRLRVQDITEGLAPTPLWRGWLSDVVPITSGLADHTARLIAVDALGVMASHPTPSTALGAWVAAGPSLAAFAKDAGAQPTKTPAVRGWWRLNESQGATELKDSSPRALGGGVAGGSIWLGRESINGDPLSSSAHFEGGNSYALLATGATIADRGVQVPFTIAFWMKCGPQSGTGSIVVSQSAGPTAWTVEVQVAGTSASNPGHLNFHLRNGTGELLIYSTGGDRVDDNRPHWVVCSYYVTATAGFAYMSVDGESVITATTPRTRLATVLQTNYAFLLGARNGGVAGWWYWGNVSDVVVLSGAVNDRYGSLQLAALLNVLWHPSGWIGPNHPAEHYPDDRARGILDVLGWPAALRSIPARGTAGLSNTAMTGHEWSQSTALAVLEEAALAEGGEVFATADGRIRFLAAGELDNAVTQTWDDGTSGVAGALPYEDVQLHRSKVTNRWVATRAGWYQDFLQSGYTSPTQPPVTAWDPASVARFREHLESIQLAIIDPWVRQARVDELLAATKLPASLIPRMTVAPSSSPAAAVAAFTAELGDRWRILHKPMGADYTLDVVVRVVGIEHVWTGRGKLRSHFSLAPF